MKLKEIALANALGLLGAIYFVGCYLVASMAPALYKSVAESWMHMLNLGGLWRQGPSNFGIGFISFVIVSWVSGYLLAWAYNRFVK